MLDLLSGREIEDRKLSLLYFAFSSPAAKYAVSDCRWKQCCVFGKSEQCKTYRLHIYSFLKSPDFEAVFGPEDKVGHFVFHLT